MRAALGRPLFTATQCSAEAPNLILGTVGGVQSDCSEQDPYLYRGVGACYAACKALSVLLMRAGAQALRGLWGGGRNKPRGGEEQAKVESELVKENGIRNAYSASGIISSQHTMRVRGACGMFWGR